MRGALSYLGIQDFMRNPSGYSEDTYRRTASATYQQLTAEAAAVTAQLIGTLLRRLQSSFDVTTLERR